MKSFKVRGHQSAAGDERGQCLARMPQFRSRNLDKNTAACTDCYQYANGAGSPPTYPAGLSEMGRSKVLNEKNLDVLHEILEKRQRTPGREGQQRAEGGRFYATCMDERNRAEG